MSANPKANLALLRPLLIVIVALAIAFGLYTTRPEREAQVQEKTTVVVDAIEVYREALQLKIQSQGTVVPGTETKLAAEVQGRIIEVGKHFVAGGFVRKGDVLLRIDDLEYKTALSRAQASVASAKTHLAEERGRAEVAYQDWLRYNKEGKRSAQAKSLALREPQIEEAEANLQAAQADLARARENLSRTAIKAPYDGLVRSRDVDLGQHVSIGTALGICFATDTVEVRLPIPEHKLALLELPIPGQPNSKTVPIELSLEINQQQHRWPATLARIESVVDERSRVLYLVAEVQDPYQLSSVHSGNISNSISDNSSAVRAVATPPLRVGTFVSALVAGKTLDNIIRIPQNVLQTDNKVWLVDSNGSMFEQSVTVIANDTDFAYITAGLNDADRIAMGYVDISVPGASVEIAKLIQLAPPEPLFTPDSLNTPALMPANALPDVLPDATRSQSSAKIARSVESDRSLDATGEDPAARGI